ncbi:MAG: DNA-directed polymerase sigma-70 factor [Labilithrix sp.]|nr:DNA-directed polymerase sigma-70 factor [Labilithrix sp.]
MNENERGALELQVRAACQRRDFDEAATLALRAYGSEIFGFLVAVLRDETAANDAFSGFAEGLWRGLPAFAWSSTLRTWAYGIARNVSRQTRRDAMRRARVGGVPTGESALENVPEAVRSSTLAFLKTEKRTQLEALRDALSADDRALLVLRLDRGLAWPDVARVLSEDGAPLDDAAALKAAVRLRKRFQTVKERLRGLVRREQVGES